MHLGRIVALALAASFALAAAASAQSSPAGNGTLAGGERIRVKGCGREAGPISLGVTMAANGNWTITEGANTYTGTAVIDGRRAVLTPSTASLALLETNLEAEASGICEETVTITSLTARGVLKVNKREDRARLRLGARGEGSSASGDAGTGSYRVRTRGAWTSLQP